LELYLDKSEILNFFSQLKWGESKDFLELARALTEQLHEQFGDKVACDQFLISRTFSSLLGNQHFALGKKRNVPMTLEQIKAIGTSAALYQLMLNEYQKPMGLSQSILSLLPSATMDQNSSDQKMKRLWCWFFAFKLGAHQDFLENILLGPNSAWSSFENELRDISLHWRKLLFSHEEIGFIFPHKLLQELKDKMKLGLALFPLPKVEKANAAWAHQLLGTNPQMSKEEIKKVFRTLALELHPDKMPAELLTPKLLTIANENFSMLKEASNWPFENGN